MASVTTFSLCFLYPVIDLTERNYRHVCKRNTKENCGEKGEGRTCVVDTICDVKNDGDNVDYDSREGNY